MMPLDRFSGHANLYAQYRIDYPNDLYDYVLSFVNSRQAAWDCATGNGQVASVLANWFERVDATDISEKQLLLAPKKPNIVYQPGPAEQTPFANQSFDLITVAQALHWFDVDAFHAEVRRVAKPGAIIAEWGYGLVQIGADLDPVLIDFYRNWIGPYWDPQRAHIDNAYASLPFPFSNAAYKMFSIYRRWSLDRFLNYLRTWSAVRQYIHENEEDPVADLEPRLRQTWPDERDIQFPVFLRIGRVG
ncbi:class I SAM-dependent methyltransferase [Spirosoma sp. SC4-14]|uniref:class I SAM-dependent methyltransferase n=1 Tax=Spirosoma sp. SC4-14 TaxID=3128900 RepID=UPI0030D4953C